MYVCRGVCACVCIRRGRESMLEEDVRHTSSAQQTAETMSAVFHISAPFIFVIHHGLARSGFFLSFYIRGT